MQGRYPSLKERYRLIFLKTELSDFATIHVIASMSLAVPITIILSSSANT